MTLAVVDGQRSWMDPHQWQWNGKGDTLKANSLLNLRNMLEHHPETEGMFEYNEFRDAIVVTRGLRGDRRRDYPRDLADHDETAVSVWLARTGLSPHISTVASLIREIAFRNKTNPLLDWIDRLQWDGTARLDEWLIRYLGADDSEYTRLVSRRFLVSAVARAMRPGCKVDTMLVLEGEQGLKKSSAVAALTGHEYFTDQLGDIGSKDGSQMIQGYWIIEVPEMEKLLSKESSTTKEFVSRQYDKYRPPYGRNVTTRARRCVFIGTINPNGVGYIKDPTGGRRFWPVLCTAVDLDGLKTARDQLWAEAHAAYLCNERWWIEAEEKHIVEGVQRDRMDEDVWEPKVADWLLEHGRSEFTLGEVLRGSVDVSHDRQDNRLKYRMTMVLKKLGCASRVTTRHGEPARIWERLL